MAVELICPDCGGVIGGIGRNAEGRGPCLCAKEESSVATERVGDSSDTVSIPAQLGESNGAGESAAPSAPAAPVAPGKACIICGKDVTGHRRVKDSRGYLCYQCAKDEVKSEKEGKIPCAECKRRVKEAGLVNYKGKKICKICYDYNKDQQRLKKKVDTKHFVEHDKRTIVTLGIIFGVLTLIVLWRLIVSMMH